MITHATIKFRGEIYKGKWHIEPMIEIKSKFCNDGGDIYLEVCNAEL